MIHIDFKAFYKNGCVYIYIHGLKCVVRHIDCISVGLFACLKYLLKAWRAELCKFKRHLLM